MIDIIRGVKWRYLLILMPMAVAATVAVAIWHNRSGMAEACDYSASLRGPRELLSEVDEAARGVEYARILTTRRVSQRVEGGSPFQFGSTLDVRSTPSGDFGTFTAHDGKSSEVYFEPGKSGRTFERSVGETWREVIRDFAEPKWSCYASEVALFEESDTVLRFRLVFASLNDGATDMVTYVEVSKDNMLPIRKISTYRHTFLYRNRVVTHDVQRICEFSEFGVQVPLPPDLPPPRT